MSPAAGVAGAQVRRRSEVIHRPGSGSERQSRPGANIHLRLSSGALSHGEPLHRLSFSGRLRQEAGDNREAPQEKKKSA